MHIYVNCMCYSPPLCKRIHGDRMVTFSGFFTLGKIIVCLLSFVKEQIQCMPQKIVADRYKKHFIIINKIMKHSNDTGHSLTVCTKTHMVFTLMCTVGVFFPFQALGKTSACCKNFCTFESFLFPHIWLFKLYLMPGKS